MITVHPNHSRRTHTRHTRHTHTLPGLRSRGPDKTGDGGDSSEDSSAGALHLLTDSYAWRSLKALPSHGTHTQINRHTHRCPHAYRHTQIHNAHIHPVSYVHTSHLFSSIHCCLSSSPLHLPTAQCMKLHTQTHLHTHTLTCQVTSEEERVEET